MGEYLVATVCGRGHTYSDGHGRLPPAERCAECGAKLLTECPGCKVHIRGWYVDPGRGLAFPYSPPDFCFNCGGPFPWANRQARIYELQNLLDREELDDADRLIASELLASLQDPELAEDEQVEKWRRLKKIAPGLMASGQRIIESVVTGVVKAKLGM